MKRNPIFGFLSVALPIFGAIGIALGMRAHDWAGVGLIMISFPVGLIGGLVFASVGLIRKEKYVFLPVCGLILSGGLALFYTSQ